MLVEIKELGIKYEADTESATRMQLLLAAGLALAMAVDRFKEAQFDMSDLMGAAVRSGGDPDEEAFAKAAQRLADFQRLVYQGSDALMRSAASMKSEAADPKVRDHEKSLTALLEALPPEAFAPSTDTPQ